MDRILLLDFNNYAWLANITFKPKKPAPIVVEGYGEVVSTFEAPQSTEEKPVPPQNPIVFNFFRNFRSLIEPFAPHKIIAVLEGHPTFRYELYPDYKANRIIKTASNNTHEEKVNKQAEAKARFDLAHPEILRLMRLMPITQVRHPFYECDDVIGALVEDCKDEDVIVVSNDSDFIQLLQKGYKQLRLYSPSKKAMQVAPSYHYITWKALHGDKSDAIPGLLGDKTAQKTAGDPELLKKWLDNEDHRANFNLNIRLIEFAKVPLEELEITEGKQNWKQLKIEFEQLDFKSLIADAYWERFRKTFKTLRY